jgi:hypothetical protein
LARLHLRHTDKRKVQLTGVGLVRLCSFVGQPPHQRDVNAARTVPPGATVTSINVGVNLLIGRSDTMCLPADPCQDRGARPRLRPSI